MNAPRTRILLTGAAGVIGQMILPALRNEFALRLVDVAPLAVVHDDEVWVVDITDVEALTEVTSGVAAIVHLAAQPFEADFMSILLPRNIVGTWSVYEAARRNGVPRVIFASSIQTVVANETEGRIDAVMPPRPSTVYACTKLWGEALARHYLDEHGVQSACLRLGWVVEPDNPRFITEPHLEQLWCSPADVSALILAALRSEVPFATMIAVSPPNDERFDTTNPFGWVPTHRR